ncbi:hypothetical protein V3564_00880 [Bartonella sp. B12(2025)]
MAWENVTEPFYHPEKPDDNVSIKRTIQKRMIENAAQYNVKNRRNFPSKEVLERLASIRQLEA